MSTRETIRLLQAADAVEALEFYVTGECNPNGRPTIACRVWDELLKNLDKADVAAFACELNTAIAPVRRALAETLKRRASESLNQTERENR